MISTEQTPPGIRGTLEATISTLMLPGVTILIYGNDVSLLETRQLILTRSGFSVCVVEKPDEAAQLIAERAAELLILCHTVPNVEAKQLLALARNTHPPMKTVVLIPARPTWIPDTADKVLGGLEGPSALLAAVQVALGQS